MAVRWDEAVLEAAAAHRTEWADGAARALMDAGADAAVMATVVVGGLVLALALRAWRPVVAVTVAFVVATVVARLGKDLVGRPRPPEHLALVRLGGDAMPSTHAAWTAAVAAALVVGAAWTSAALRRAATLVAGGWVVVVGAAMVYLGAHWLTDVLVGWALGVAVGTAAGVLVRAPSRTVPAAPDPPR